MSTVEIPIDFCCPITGSLLTDPLMTRYGQNYEREAILTWISNHHNTCPTTRLPLKPSDLVPNRALQLKIRMWCEANNVDIDTPGFNLEGSRNPDQVYLSFRLPENTLMPSAARELRMEHRANMKMRIRSMISQQN